MRHPVTPDRRYFVVRGRLWRCSDPALADDARQRLTRELMQARAAVGRALRTNDAEAERDARARVHAAKCALGERGAPWWDDGAPDYDAPDYNRRLVRNTPYAAWHASLADTPAEKPT
jgi:hypothetical protein